MRTLAVLVLVGLGLAVVPAAEGAKRAKTPRLKAFQSCAGLISYARRHAPTPKRVVAPPPPFRPAPMPVSGGGDDGGAPPPMAAPAPAPESGAVGEDTSSTNIQEAGVDEPDIVKSDGRNVFALTGGRLHAVEARSPVPSKLDSVPIGGSGGELLAQGRRVLTMSRAAGGGTILTEIDIANPAAMRVLRTLTVDGDYVSARLHDHTVRVVLRSTPRALDVPIPTPPPMPIPVARHAGGRRRVAAKRKPLRARKAGWVPSATLRNRRTGRKRKRAIVACDDVRRTPRFTGAGMLTVLTIDLQRGLPAVDSDAVMTGRRDGLRVGRPASTSRRAAAGSATTRRSTASTSPATRAPSTARAARSRATCSTSSRSPSTRACCARPPRRTEAARRRATSPCSRPRAPRSSGSARSAASAAPSASTRCASSATAATSSRSARSTRSTRSTSPIRARRR